MALPPRPPGYYVVDGKRRRWDGTAWHDAPPAPKAPQPSRNPKQPMSCSARALIFLAVVVVAVAIAVYVGTRPPSATSTAADDQATTQSLCESEVKDQLKSPSTANFSNESATGSNPIIVTGDVDAENSFGAMIRANFQCTGTLAGSDGIDVALNFLHQRE